MFAFLCAGSPSSLTSMTIEVRDMDQLLVILS